MWFMIRFQFEKKWRGSGLNRRGPTLTLTLTLTLIVGLNRRGKKRYMKNASRKKPGNGYLQSGIGHTGVSLRVKWASACLHVWGEERSRSVNMRWDSLWNPNPNPNPNPDRHLLPYVEKGDASFIFWPGYTWCSFRTTWSHVVLEQTDYM